MALQDWENLRKPKLTEDEVSRIPKAKTDDYFSITGVYARLQDGTLVKLDSTEPPTHDVQSHVKKPPVLET